MQKLKQFVMKMALLWIMKSKAIFQNTEMMMTEPMILLTTLSTHLWNILKEITLTAAEFLQLLSLPLLPMLYTERQPVPHRMEEKQDRHLLREQTQCTTETAMVLLHP